MPDNLPLIFRSLLAKRQQAQAQAQVRVLQNEPTGKAAASRPLFMSGVVYMAPLSEALSHDDFYHKQGEHCNTTALWAMFYDSCKGWINVMRSNIKQNQVGAIGTGAAATAATNNNVAELDAKFFHEYGHRYQSMLRIEPTPPPTILTKSFPFPHTHRSNPFTSGGDARHGPGQPEG